MTAQRISVIIPAFNAQSYIAETIESVLKEEWTNLEILVVDDGSTDNTLGVARRFEQRLRILTGEHRGLAATRNRGISAATGDFLLHLDADDLLVPCSIAARMRFLLSHPECDMVTGRLVCFISPDVPQEMRSRFQVPPAPQQGHMPGTAIIRANAFRRFGLLDESFLVNADLDWWVRARDVGAKIGAIEDIVLHRRIHGKNQTLMRKAELASTQIMIVRRSLERRRKQAQVVHRSSPA